LPEGVPGAAVSPGSNTCSRENGPAIAGAALSWTARARATHAPARATRSAWRTTNLLKYGLPALFRRSNPTRVNRCDDASGDGRSTDRFHIQAGGVPRFHADCAARAAGARSSCATTFAVPRPARVAQIRPKNPMVPADLAALARAFLCRSRRTGGCDVADSGSQLGRHPRQHAPPGWASKAKRAGR